jgi:ubiquinone/menaquinone biosynthesis C-methylase UbiE
MGKIFLAKYNNEYISSMMILIFGDKAWYMYAGSDNRYEDVKANYILIWEMIKWSKERGAKCFDFRGAGAWNIPSHPARGIYEFKKRFGPSLCEFIDWQFYVLYPWIFSAVEKILIFFKKFISFITRTRGKMNKIFLKGARSSKYIKSVRDKYGTDEEVKEYSRRLFVDGLGYDEKIIDKHFNQKGKIIDIGCGAGREAIKLAKKRFDVTGTDLQPRMVDEAKKNAETFNVKADFLAMDACKLEFADNTFDYALMLGIFGHIPGRVNRVQALKEVRRVLKPDGKFIVSVPSKKCSFKHRAYFFVADNLFRFLNMAGIKYLEPGDRFTKKVSGEIISKGKAFLHMYSIKELDEDIKEAGLTALEYTSRNELINNINDPKSREKDYFIFAVSKKKLISFNLFLGK